MANELDKYFETFEESPREKPRSILARGSKVVRVEYQDGDGNWRSRIKMSRKMFDDRAKEIFLETFRKWGRMGDSAAAAGVTTPTVRQAMVDDEDFAEALLTAEEEYTNKLIGHHQDLVFNGTVKKTYDRNGMLISEETIYPHRLIELELKKHDSGYREKQEIKHEHSGGVLVVPTGVDSVADWESKFSKSDDIEEAEVVKPEEIESPNK